MSARGSVLTATSAGLSMRIERSSIEREMETTLVESNANAGGSISRNFVVFIVSGAKTA